MPSGIYPDLVFRHNDIVRIPVADDTPFSSLSNLQVTIQYKSFNPLPSPLCEGRYTAQQSGGSRTWLDIPNITRVGTSGIVNTNGFLLIHRDDSGYGKFSALINGRSIAYGSGDGSYGGSTHLYTIPIAKNCYCSMNGNGI